MKMHTEGRRESFILHIRHELNLFGWMFRHQATTEIERLLIGKPDQYFLGPKLNEIYLHALKETDAATGELPSIRLAWIGGKRMVIVVGVFLGLIQCCSEDELKEEIIQYEQKRSHANSGG